MDIIKIKDGKRVRYTARKHSGIGRVIEVYERLNGTWVALHDKQRNESVTVRPSQVAAI